MQLYDAKLRYNCLGGFTIAATPTLEGDDAKRFYEEMAENEKKKMSNEEFESITNDAREILNANPQIKRMFGINVI
ncbi:hypothetical protein NO2_0320 [Candidatus Termititenax persephonae]|uniref:Uncharacterized protein n=1 Tax=Candidatus Termititenax persephonae TaxID=2218525 RepID=A0A388TF50_9BACT|nr:hypothetical protein NO2_0320 [Candidatus Termititenax persephonae]